MGRRRRLFRVNSLVERRVRRMARLLVLREEHRALRECVVSHLVSFQRKTDLVFPVHSYHGQQQQQPPYDPRPNVQPQQGPAVLSPDGRPRSYIGQTGGGGGSSYQGYAAPPGGGPSPQQSGYAAPLQ